MSKKSVKTVGILTSGGDAPGLNAAIRGVCRSGMINYGMKFIGIKNGYRGLVNGDAFPITSENISGILTRLLKIPCQIQRQDFFLLKP